MAAGIRHRAGRIVLFTAGVAAPGLIVLGALAGLGLVTLETALVAGGATLAAAALIAVPFAIALAGLHDAVALLQREASTPGEGSPLLPTLRGTLGHAFERVVRQWRLNVAAAATRAAAAETVIAALPDPLILIDGKRQIVRTNPQSAEFVGIVAEPRDLAEALRHPAVLEAADAVLRGEAGRVVEFTAATPVERWLRARFARVDGPALDGAVAVLTLHDITELKRAEQMRGDFIANASHELKTPLATLSGFIETLRGPARGDAEAHERFLAIMQGEAARMARLVQDLLSLSRIELNEHVTPTGQVALEPVVRQVVDTLELHAASRRMTIALDLPPGLPPAIGDADEVAQVLHNLLDNAIKYGREGSAVTVTAGLTRRAGLDGPRRHVTQFAWVAVDDCGEGIPREHLSRLTERFYRVDTARSRQMGGTGLGLAIVKHILNRHRGLLEIDSTLGRGSRFTILLRTAAGGAEPPVIEP